MKMFKLDEMTNEQLEELSVEIYNEKRARANARRDALVATFKEAWKKLEENGLWVNLIEDYCEGETIHYHNVEITD